MKRLLLALAVIVLFAVPAFAEPGWSVSGTLTGGVVTDNTTLTLTLPQYMGDTAYLYVPTITSATIALSGSADGTTFGTIYDEQTNGTTKIAWSVGATTGGYMVELPPIQVFRKIKITAGAAQAANRVFVIYGTRK